MFVAFGAVGWLGHAAHPETGPIGWFVTIVWTIPVTLAVVGVAGAVFTARKRRHRDLPAAGFVPELLLVVVPTVGRTDTVPALERVVESFREHLPRRFPTLRIDVIVEEGCEAGERIAALANDEGSVRIVTVPTDYRTANGTRFKARANQYAVDLRLVEGEATNDVWVLHMDDDTGIGEETVESLAAFIDAQRSAGSRRLHLAQGILTYPRECARHPLTWLADAVRPGCDFSLFAASTGLGTPRGGLHGELLLVRASVEASIGWDFGRRSIVEDAEFALRFCARYPGCSGWIAGRSYGASPATVADFVRQRERWIWGLLVLATNRTIPRRHRLVLIHNVAVWACGPLQHPALILMAGAVLGDLDATPATAALIPLWTLNVSYVVWLYWEGLRINASSSAVPRRQWWEPLALLVSLPLFAAWEAAGVARGVVRFLRRDEATFTVIAKPL